MDVNVKHIKICKTPNSFYDYYQKKVVFLESDQFLFLEVIDGYINGFIVFNQGIFMAQDERVLLKDINMCELTKAIHKWVAASDFTDKEQYLDPAVCNGSIRKFLEYMKAD